MVSTNSLTGGELMLLVRKRRGLSQKQAGENCDVSRATWSKWERDIVEPPFGTVMSEPPTAQELAMLQRRRKGMTQKDIAEEVGCSRYWVSQMETGQADSKVLEGYWE